jgi:hypothetical protein
MPNLPTRAVGVQHPRTLRFRHATQATLTPEQRRTFENVPLNMHRRFPQVQALIRKFPTALATGNSELKKQLYNALTTFISDFNLEWNDGYTQDFPPVLKDLQENLDIKMRLDTDFMVS